MTQETHCTAGTYHWPWPLSPLALHCVCVLTWTWYWEVSCIMMLELEYFFLCSVRNKKRSISCFSLDPRITTLSLSQSPELPAQAPRALPAGVSPEQALPFLELCLGDFTFLLGQPRAFKSSLFWCTWVSTILPMAWGAFWAPGDIPVIRIMKRCRCSFLEPGKGG